LAVARLLLEGGADPNLRTLYPTPGPAGEVRINPASPGSSAFHVAANARNTALIKLLADWGADVIKIEPPLLGDTARYLGSSRTIIASLSPSNRNTPSSITGCNHT